MTENQLYYGIIISYLAIIVPLVAGAFWLQHKKNKQQQATADRLKRENEDHYADIAADYEYEAAWERQQEADMEHRGRCDEHWDGDDEVRR